jgi:hypothetical protein
MKPTSSKFFAKAWREWLEKAETDPAAQEKVDRVVKHPEFELYHIKNDPWELNNLAENPDYTQNVGEMHAQLKAEMDKLKDVFSTVDPKAAKRAKKGKPERSQGTEPTEKPKPSELTDKQKKREARKQARKKGKEE